MGKKLVTGKNIGKKMVTSTNSTRGGSEKTKNPKRFYKRFWTYKRMRKIAESIEENINKKYDGKGYVKLHVSESSPSGFYIDVIEVYDDYRGQGIGTEMMNDIIKEAKRKNVGWIALEAFPKSDGEHPVKGEQIIKLVKWYQRFGFDVDPDWYEKYTSIDPDKYYYYSESISGEPNSIWMTMDIVPNWWEYEN